MKQSSPSPVRNPPKFRFHSSSSRLLAVALVVALALGLLPGAVGRAEAPLAQVDPPAPTPLVERQTLDEIPYLREKRLTDQAATIGGDYHFILSDLGLAQLDAADAGAAFRTDEFDADSLNTALWRFENPVGDGWLHLQPVGSNNGALALHAPGERSHDPWSANRSVRVMQSGPDRDLTFESKFLSTPQARYQMQGLMVEQDAANWLRFELQHDGDALRALAIATVDGVSTLLAQADLSALPAGDGSYLHVTRTGNSWLFAYASDGRNWQTIGSFHHPMTVTGAGPYVADHHPTSAQTPAYTALVDYFRSAGTEQTKSPHRRDGKSGALDPWHHHPA